MNPCRSLKFHYWLYWDLLWELQTTKLKRVVSKFLKVIQHRTKGIPSQEIIIPPWEEGAYTSVGPNPLTMCLIWTKLESIDIISSTNFTVMAFIWSIFFPLCPWTTWTVEKHVDRAQLRLSCRKRRVISPEYRFWSITYWGFTQRRTKELRQGFVLTMDSRR